MYLIPYKVELYYDVVKAPNILFLFKVWMYLHPASIKDTIILGSKKVVHNTCFTKKSFLGECCRLRVIIFL